MTSSEKLFLPISDCASQVAAKALETAVFGAYYNVMINLKDITDDAFRLAVSFKNVPW